METLVVAAQHRNQSIVRTGSQERFNLRGGLKGINCRAYESGTGILPYPNNIVANHVLHKSPLRFHSEPPKSSKQSNPIPIITPKSLAKQFKETTGGSGLSCPELWAGPAYSNSPPPSSLPMPKFTLRPKRSFSLDIPTLLDHGLVELQQMAKSAPSSPNRGLIMAKSAPSSPTRGSISPSHDFFVTTASATETLRRILRLDD